MFNVTENLLTIIEIENSLKTKYTKYMLLRTEEVADGNIYALFIPIAPGTNLTKRKRNKLVRKNCTASNIEKMHKQNKLIGMKLCWANNICRTGIKGVLNVQKMEQTQIDVNNHLFEIIEIEDEGKYYA